MARIRPALAVIAAATTPDERARRRRRARGPRTAVRARGISGEYRFRSGDRSEAGDRRAMAQDCGW